jgi:excisionase family DNA binding protein
MKTDASMAPTEKDTAAARALLQALKLVRGTKDVSVAIKGQRLKVPAVMVSALIEAAELISEEHAIDVIPADEEVSAQEAADLLKVSRPYLVNLVKKGVLPSRMVGAHHRIPMAAVIAYKREQAPRRRSLEALTAETQDLTGFVIDVALQRAEAIVRQNEVITLTRAEWDRFQDMLLNPPGPNKRLKKALAEHARVVRR